MEKATCYITVHGSGVQDGFVLTTEGKAMADQLVLRGHNLYSWPLLEPRPPGLGLTVWEGEMTSGDMVHPRFEGAWRRPTPHELRRLCGQHT